MSHLLDVDSRSGVLAVNYHKIGRPERSQFDHGLWSADEEAFAAQVRFLRSNLDLIGVAELPHVMGRRGRYGLITFDDGYKDNYERAFPILQAEGASATFFVATQFLDVPQLPWWDEIAYMVRTSPRSGIDLPQWLSVPLHFDEPRRETAVRVLLRTYKRMPSERTGDFLQALSEATGSSRYKDRVDCWMTWDMLREMHAAGMTIGGHTMSHAILARMSADGQRQQILGCARRLGEELHEPMRYFSYPVGGLSAFDDTTRTCLREAGVRYAFSYYGGFRSFADWDDYDIRRVPIEMDTTIGQFRRIVRMPNLFA